MSNLTNLVTEQFNELNTSYENQKKQTQEKFLYKQKECEGEHKEAIAQLNIELKSNEAQLLNLIRNIELKRGSMVTVEELASVLTLISDPINPTNSDSFSTLEDEFGEDESGSKSTKKGTRLASKTKKATSTTSKEKVISKDTSSKAMSKDITKDITKDATSDIIKDTTSDITKDTSTTKPTPKYKGKYYR
ncbi:MAG: hypothetical protein R3Y29_00015 [bacterium]